ncbi:uncharacterized protein LOC130693067 [Daphnia carinata]|uniref:uncharacterized protein LOC130693067 n=1 Tax=Daphnia carinata TaxID=120202 RepID=UPI00257B765B|nr:uncharacterized protein LOC130693067 [Daphnia carinata]
MCRLTSTMITGALVLATLWKETTSFTIHRLNDASHLDDSHETLFNRQHTSGAAVGLASLDGQLNHSSEEDVHSSSAEHRLTKRSTVRQLTPEEWQLIVQHDRFDSSEEVDRLFLQENIQTNADFQRFLANRQWTRDVSDELQGSWEVEDVELLKKLFGDAWEPVKDRRFDHTSVEDLMEVWLHQNNAQRLPRDERL